MTVIQPNSISGINSITVQSGEGLSVHKSDGSLIREIVSATGVGTFYALNVGSATTVSNAGDVAISGIVTANGGVKVAAAATISANGNATFSGVTTAKAADLQTGPFNVGTAATISANGNATFSGIVTAASYAGDGSALTGIAGTEITDSDFAVGVSTFFVDYSTSNVGINTVVPTSALDVTGDAKVSGICTAAAFVPDYHNANIIINGAMEVRQRDEPVTATGFLVDRWRMWESTGGQLSVSQEEDAPSGLYQSMKFDVTTADTSLGVSEYCVFEQRVEGIKVRQLGFGAAGAESVTVSFYVKTDKTGTYSCTLCNSASNRSYVIDYTVGDTNWNRYSLTFPGDTGGTWVKTEGGVGLKVRWALAVGSNYQNTTGGWRDADVLGTSSCVNFMDSTSNNFYITGVQVQRGSYATPFEYKGYSQEQMDCFRYFLRYKPGLRGSTYNTGDVNATTNLAVGIQYDSDDAHFTKDLPVAMCKVPTIPVFTDIRIMQGGSMYDTATIVQQTFSDFTTLDLHIDNGGSIASYGCFLGMSSTNSDFQIDAEI